MKRALCTAWIVAAALSTGLGALAAPSWAGTDETVVEPLAAAAGREVSPPLLPVEEGDLLLFAFLMAGCVGGFCAGYAWRALQPGDGER